MRSLANIHSRERSANMCTRSAFKIYICIHSALLFLFGVHCSLCLQVRMQYYTCFRDYGFIFSSFMLFLLSDTHHESHNYKLRSMNREFLSIITCSASLFLLLLLSLSPKHTHTLLLTLAFECTVAECVHMPPTSIRFVSVFSFSFHSLRAFFQSGFSCYGHAIKCLVRLCEHDNRNAVSDLKRSKWTAIATKPNEKEIATQQKWWQPKKANPKQMVKENKWKMQQFNNERPYDERRARKPNCDCWPLRWWWRWWWHNR